MENNYIPNNTLENHVLKTSPHISFDNQTHTSTYPADCIIKQSSQVPLRHGPVYDIADSTVIPKVEHKSESLLDELWGHYCEEFGQKLPHHNGTAMYINTTIIPINHYRNHHHLTRKIVELLVYICHFSNTPLGLNREFISMCKCNKCNEVEVAHGALLLSLLNVRCTNWSVPQFQKDKIECMIYDVCVNWSCYFMVMYLLMSEYLLAHARLSCMNDWLLGYSYLFTLTCSYFFLYWDLLNPNKLLNW